LALSATYYFSTKTTFAIVYGCNDGQKKEILERVRLAGNNLEHPLLVAGIFAELERDRLVRKAEDLGDEFALGADMLEMKPRTLDQAFENGRIQKYLRLCLESRNLVDQIRAVKRQLAKLEVQVDELEAMSSERLDDVLSSEER